MGFCFPFAMATTGEAFVPMRAASLRFLLSLVLCPCPPLVRAGSLTLYPGGGLKQSRGARNDILCRAGASIVARVGHPTSAFSFALPCSVSMQFFLCYALFFWNFFFEIENL